MNPFKPTAGKTPPALIGRDYVIDEFLEGVENGPGSPSRLMRITGMRGMGKTVMLNEVARQAEKLGWAVVEETASPGFCERTLAATTALSSPSGRVSRIVASPSALGVSLGTVEIDRAALSLRDAFAKTIEKNGKGLLITLDEAQDAPLDEMRALSVAVQHEIRSDRSIAFVFAGLPSMIESVVNGRTLTFLRRATPIELTPLNRAEVVISLEATFEKSGVKASRNLCETLAEAARGYPFMVQLVGYHAWQQAHNNGSAMLDEQTIEQGIAIARERFDATVIEPALQRLPASSIDYLLAMALDGGAESQTGQIATRLGKTAQQLSTCRSRLIREDVIQSSGWGRVSFAIPYMAGYLNEHREELASRSSD